MKSKKASRESSIELLRIVAMMLIMVGHCYFRFRPLPQEAAIADSPLTSFLDVMLSCITTTGVGIFIAISGWFGIKFKTQGLAKYLFMVIFTLWTVYGIALALHLSEFSLSGLKTCMGFYEGYWFVLGYLGLYLISPLLNTFIEHATKKELQIVLLSYYLFQSYISWLSGWYDYYNGYSILLFAGIYLTAAYFRRYPVDWMDKYAPQLWVTTIMLMTVIAFLSLWGLGFAGRQIRDDNPLAIIASILLVITFSKLKFQNSLVNWLAASCFAVYLIHYSPYVYPYVIHFMQNVHQQYDGLLYVMALLAALLAVFVGCTLFDQIRILTWSLIQKTVFKK